MPALDGHAVRDGVLTAVESITTLDAGFWTNFGDPDVGQRIQSGELRPDWQHRGFLRGYTDERYSFGRYFSPLEPNRPNDHTRLVADNDVVLYDRQLDPGELVNLADDPAHADLVADLLEQAGGADHRRDRRRHPSLGDRAAATAGLAHVAR